jgi:outer membrane receptor protein involved in Fe transport
VRTKSSLLVTVAALMYGTVSLANTVTVNIDAQPMEPALNAFAQQAGLQLLMRADLVGDIKAPRLVGTFEVEDALARLLANTHLTYRFIDAGTVAIRATDDRTTGSPELRGEEGALRLAQADASATTAQEQTQQADAEQSANHAQLEEIVVTAQKRAERLQDVPVPVTAVNAESLLGSNQTRLEDYFTRIPGLSMSYGRNSPILAIRGIVPGSVNPTVAVLLDDAPYGSSIGTGGGVLVADIDPNDLARVEVLRGPQGTLYGASSLGGLIKFVTVDPSTQGVSGRLQAGLTDFANGDGVGYNVRGSVNLPLSQTWAIRASAFTRDDPGYIDQARTGEEGVNSVDAKGARLAALWQPSDALSLRLSALMQRIRDDASSQMTLSPDVGDLEQDVTPGLGWSSRKFFAYSANLNAKVGAADLTAVSSYTINRFRDNLFFFGADGLGIPENNRTRRFTQEIRASVPLAERVDGLLGLFYSNERSRYVQFVNSYDPDTGVENPGGNADGLSFPTTGKDYAVFADVTFRITDRFDIQLGGRESWNRQSYEQIGLGAYAPFGTPYATSKDNAFTYLIAPRLRLSPDVMLYARLASGFRNGGPNSAPPVANLTHYGSDKTQNYEVGLKGDFADRRVSVDASVYYIDWKDIQLPGIGVTTFTINGNTARSQGAELALQMRPVAGLSVNASAAFNDAELTEDLPPIAVQGGSFGLSGERLPLSSRFTGSLSVHDEFRLGPRALGFAGATFTYVGNRYSDFQAEGAVRPRMPAYRTIDLLAGVRYDEWTVNVFANNVGNKHGLLTAPAASSVVRLYDIIPPRTLGVSLVRQF